MALSSLWPFAHSRGLDCILGPMTSYLTGQASHPPHAYTLPGLRTRNEDGTGSGLTSSGGAGLQYGRD